jgi:hypothetical protein
VGSRAVRSGGAAPPRLIRRLRSVAVAIAVPVVMAAATPSPAVRPAVTVRPVADDKGGDDKAEPGDDKGKGGDDD